MFTSKNLVESRVVRMFWNDGLLDVLAGSGLVLMGVAWLFDLVPLGAIGPAILIPIWKPLRARFTEPRLGYVEFSDTQQRRNRTFLAVAIGLGVVTLVAGVAVYRVVINGFELFTPRTVPALPACIIGFMALMTAADHIARQVCWLRLGLVFVWGRGSSIAVGARMGVVGRRYYRRYWWGDHVVALSPSISASGRGKVTRHLGCMECVSMPQVAVGRTKLRESADDLRRRTDALHPRASAAVAGHQPGSGQESRFCVSTQQHRA